MKELLLCGMLLITLCAGYGESENVLPIPESTTEPFRASGSFLSAPHYFTTVITAEKVNEQTDPLRVDSLITTSVLDIKTELGLVTESAYARQNTQVQNSNQNGQSQISEHSQSEGHRQNEISDYSDEKSKSAWGEKMSQHVMEKLEVKVNESLYHDVGLMEETIHSDEDGGHSDIGGLEDDGNQGYASLGKNGNHSDIGLEKNGNLSDVRLEKNGNQTNIHYENEVRVGNVLNPHHNVEEKMIEGDFNDHALLADAPGGVAADAGSDDLKDVPDEYNHPMMGISPAFNSFKRSYHKIEPIKVYTEISTKESSYGTEITTDHVTEPGNTHYHERLYAAPLPAPRIEEEENAQQQNGTLSGEGIKVPTVRRWTLIKQLTQSQFSWVDIIIAVSCSVAILLVLINIGVFLQYCIYRHKQNNHYRPPPSPPTQSTFCVRMDSLRVRPNYRQNFATRLCKKLNFTPPLFGRSCESTDTLSPTNSVGTQYENMEAMIASFISNDLIVELNDRDSTCTSISEGFTFSRDYGTPQPIEDGGTEL